MDKKTALSKKDSIVFRSVSFWIMCFLTLISIAAAIKNDIFRDSYICTVVITNIVCLIFLTVLAGVLLSKKEEPAGPMRYFTLFLLNIHISAFFSTLTYGIYGIPGCAHRITILGTINYFFMISIFLTLWLYQKQFLEETLMTRIVTVLIASTIIVYAAALMINLYRPIMFQITEEGTLAHNGADYISICTDFFCLLFLSIATFSSNLSANRKISFFCCIFTPVLFSALAMNQNISNWSILVWGMININVVLPLFLIFFGLHDELENDILRHEKEQARLQLSAMISQMQPHFLYNSLAVIEALCEEDPKLAAQATNEFSNYLRENLDFADRLTPIPFSEELKHIKTYVWLEKLRFPNKVNIEYDIKCTSFYVPALSVQPMVENAIKHGLCKSRAGGTVRICSYEAENSCMVTVSDDGVGFDSRKTVDDHERHLGIKNTRYRIREMVNGSLEIESAPGKGTTVTIMIPK